MGSSWEKNLNCLKVYYSFRPPDLINKQLLVRGVLKKEQFIPEATIDEYGGISSGATGKQYVLEMIEYSKVTK